jgi:hypothetical protein
MMAIPRNPAIPRISSGSPLPGGRADLKTQPIVARSLESRLRAESPRYRLQQRRTHAAGVLPAPAYRAGIGSPFRQLESCPAVNRMKLQDAPATFSVAGTPA